MIPADLSANSYLVIGLATCFLRTEDGVDEITIIEPIPSSALSVIVDGSPTSYRFIAGTTLDKLLTASPEFPVEFINAQLGKEFADRSIAAARTYQTHPDLQALVPLGTTKLDLNYSVERKRVLNIARKISKSDNVKQHAYTHQKL
jgi:hypothetical protein